jgi:hypothetical protein
LILPRFHFAVQSFEPLKGSDSPLGNGSASENITNVRFAAAWGMAQQMALKHVLPAHPENLQEYP